MKDYYKILGVAPDATMTAIKKAYRALAFKYHPDRNPGNPQAANDMTELNGAYRILSDAGLRAQYDAERRPRAPVGFTVTVQYWSTTSNATYADADTAWGFRA